MRPVLHADVVAAARCLLGVKADKRPALVAELIARSERAERFQRVTGRAHPVFGNGCLEAAAARFFRPAEPFLDDPDYCGCMLTVFEALLVHVSRARR